MQQVSYDGANCPVLSWADLDSLDETCKQQVINLCSLPFVANHVALMPDAHGGYGMPIGGVLATNNVVIPNAVGVNIRRQL